MKLGLFTLAALAQLSLLQEVPEDQQAQVPEDGAEVPATQDTGADGQGEEDIDPTVDPDADPDADPEIEDQEQSDTDPEPITTILRDNGLNEISIAIDIFPQVVDPLLEDSDGWTIFGPQDADFQAAAGGLNDDDAVIAILEYHFSTDSVNPEDLDDGDQVVVETTYSADGLEGDPQVVIVSNVEGAIIVSYGLGTVTVTDPIEQDGNWIHNIDGVLIPPISPSETASEAGLTSLVDTLTEADLVETVDSATKITIFAPNNEAFDAAEVDPENLEETLTYHVVVGVAYSVGLESGQYETLQGGTVDIEVTEDGVTVNGANVVIADVLTSNGVVHVIDAVLDPADAGGKLSHFIQSAVSNYILY